MARIRCAEQYFQLYRAQSPDEASNDVLRSQPYLLALARGPLTAPLRQSPVGGKPNFANGLRRRFSRFKSNKYARRCLFDRREPGHALLLRAAPAGQGASSQKSLAFAGEEVLGKFYGDCQGHGWFANASNDIWRIGVGSLVVAFWGTL